MQLLQEALDDPTAAPCGRCSVCLGRLPDGVPARPSDAVTRSVATALRRGHHVVEPRLQWPGGAFGSRKRIPPDRQPARGRALAFADAPEWRELIDAAFARDAPAPPELLDAVVQLLSAWRAEWPARPEVVVGLPAAGFPDLTGSVVAHIAAAGRLPALVLPVGPPASADPTSADEAAHWRDALGPPESLPAEVGDRVVLLVVDATSTLWPVTVATAALREAGAAKVLPLVIHRRP
jgi:ATP-dependent DNA helicase RecQ